MSESSERKVWEHDWAIKSLREGQLRTDAGLEDVKRDVNHIHQEREKDRIALAEFISTARAAAEAAKDAAEKSVTTKQFYLGVATAAAAIVGILLGVK